MVASRQVAGLLGDHVRSAAHGSLSALRHQHRQAACRNTVPGHPERYVTVVAQYHPKPVPAPAKSCSEGWVYAGSPDKYAPACQEADEGHGRTQLLVRWQPYVVRVTIGRSDLGWAGDPEIALAMSRDLARRLGVNEAHG